jgi:putative Mn2+ efflux pump MntP
MWAVLIIGLMTGLDNLQAASSIGMMPLAPRRRWPIALAFALCEAGMPLLGLLIGTSFLALFGHVAGWVAPLVLASCGAAIVALALRERSSEALANSRWIQFGLPLSLSLDNLLAGVAISSLGVPLLPAALLIGCISGTLSLLGMFVGARVRSWLPDHIELINGAWLVTAALLMIYFDA